jgi:hypothetical protein
MPCLKFARRAALPLLIALLAACGHASATRCAGHTSANRCAGANPPAGAACGRLVGRRGVLRGVRALVLR